MKLATNELVLLSVKEAKRAGCLCIDEIDTDYGQVKFYNRCGTSDISIIRGVVTISERGGEYITGLPDSVYEVYHDQDAIWLDVGGHVGSFCVRWAVQFGVKEIHSYEPMPSSYTFLKKNIALNGLQAVVHPHKLAIVGGAAADITLYVGGMAATPNTGSHSIIKKRGRLEMIVHAVNIDDVIDETGATCVKLDVEGAEYEIIMNSELMMGMTVIVMEYHFSCISDTAGLPKYWKMVDLLKDNFKYVKYHTNPENLRHCRIIACKL